MIKKICVFVVMAAFIITASAIAEVSKTEPMVNHKAITGAEPLPQVPAYPYNPNVTTTSPGIVLGTTWYDYQTNGSTGNRIALTDSNTIYVDWMNALNYPPPPRHIYQNYRDALGNWIEGGCQVDIRPAQSAGAGYTTLDVYQGYRGAFAYHYTDATPYHARLALDDADYPGFCIFSIFDVPNLIGGIDYIWPYVTVDRNDRIHIVMSEPTDAAGDPQRVMYTRSADGGATWTTPAMVDTVMTISTVIDASPVSDKVIIAYNHPALGFDSQWNNDVMYILSNDGISWDWRNGKVNVTNYGGSDSLWAYTDLDVIFDYNDNFHLIWNAQWVTDQGIYYRTYLYHYNSATEQINMIKFWPDSLWVSCSGAWNRPMCKMNFGVQPNSNTLYATWTQFDTADVAQSTYCNGDIYASRTTDGSTWQWDIGVVDTNLTDSHTPGCFPEDCDSDHWSSLADVVDNAMHIAYINDKDAGGIPQTEGIATENPVMYLEVPVQPTGIDDDVRRPISFSLDQNYPNPFNAKTNIAFELKETAPVLVEVFDITGGKVATLADEVMTAGAHSITWDASNVASGIYYYRLSAGESSQTKQAVLIK